MGRKTPRKRGSVTEGLPRGFKRQEGNLTPAGARKLAASCRARGFETRTRTELDGDKVVFARKKR